MYFLFLVEYVMSRRRNRNLKLNGYTYSAILRGGPGLKIRWRCSSHSTTGCPAMVHTINDELVYIRDVHNHEKKEIPKYLLIM